MPGKQHVKPRLTKREKKAQVCNCINVANGIADLLSNLQHLTSYSKHSLNLKIECVHSKSLNESEIQQIFTLLKTNMQQLYEKSDWGWDEETKMSELRHPSARFLIVRDADQKIVGFSHFRFDVELNIPILYCYELQIDDQYQRKGIGKHLMNTLAVLAKHLKILKIILTVFKDNIAGINFYMKSLLFKRDITCPYDEEGKCYLILRKNID